MVSSHTFFNATVLFWYACSPRTDEALLKIWVVPNYYTNSATPISCIIVVGTVPSHIDLNLFQDDSVLILTLPHLNVGWKEFKGMIFIAEKNSPRSVFRRHFNANILFFFQPDKFIEWLYVFWKDSIICMLMFAKDFCIIFLLLMQTGFTTKHLKTNKT